MKAIIDKHEIYMPYKASCSNCKNGFDLINLACVAFPKGIPDEILSGDDKHEEPLKDQGNAVVFSPHG